MIARDLPHSFLHNFFTFHMQDVEDCWICYIRQRETAKDEDRILEMIHFN